MGCVSSKPKKQMSVKNGQEEIISINMDSPRSNGKSDFSKADSSKEKLGNHIIKIQFSFKL